MSILTRVEWLCLGAVLGLVVGLMVGATVAVVAQTPSKENVTCEMQVGEQYKQLVAKQVLVPPTGTMAWEAQLQSIISEFRDLRTQYDIEVQQHQLSKRNFATIANRYQDAQQSAQGLAQQVSELKAELEKAKQDVPPKTN